MFDDKTNISTPEVTPTEKLETPTTTPEPVVAETPAPQGYSPTPNGPMGPAAVGGPVQLERDEDGYIIFPKEPFQEVSSGSSSINVWLTQNTNNFVPCKSVYDNRKVTYDKFLAELTYDLFDLILKTNLLKTKAVVNKIKKQLVYILVSTKDLPDIDRDLIFNTTLRVIDFLKTVVYYPETDKINEEVIVYLPMLKEIAMAFKSFLSKNR